MEIHKFTVPANRGSVIEIVPIGDIHLGTKNCDEKKLLSIVEYIKNRKDIYFLGMGDYCDFLNYSDKRFDPDDLADFFRNHLSNLHIAQLTRIIQIFKPIQDKCIGLLSGNHEESIRLKYHTSVADIMAYELKTVHLGYNCFIQFVMKRTSGNTSQMVTIFATHGAGAGRKAGGKINRVRDLSEDFEADIYLMGHVHSKIVEDDERLGVTTRSNNPHLQARKRLFGVTGTFYKTYEVGTRSYAEKSLYPPTPTGVIKITIEPFRHDQKGGDRELPPHLHISA